MVADHHNNLLARPPAVRFRIPALRHRLSQCATDRLRNVRFALFAAAGA
jgi:hypothetical protein